MRSGGSNSRRRRRNTLEGGGGLSMDHIEGELTHAPKIIL